MRVLIFAPHFAEYSLRFANSLAELTPTKLIVAKENLRQQTGGLSLRASSKLEVEALPLDTNRGKYFNLLKVAASIARYRPDIIHMQEVPHPICMMVASLFGRRCKIVLTVHDPMPHSGADAQLSSHRLWSMNRARRMADLAVVHGRYCRECLEAEPALPLRIAETRHGEVLVPSKEQTRVPEPGRLLFFGRMQAYKGLDTLTAAAELLHNRKIPFTLHVAGVGPELDRFAPRLTRLPEVILENRFLAPEDAVVAMQLAEVLVLPYRDATQSGVIAAAFANGRPVIASRVGGIPDVVEEGVSGLLVPPGDPDALADAIQSVLMDRTQLTSLADGAGRVARQLLDWDGIAQEMLAEYARSLAGDEVPGERG